MAENLDRLLDSLGADDVIPEPPAPFLRAVGRRRLRRRLAHSAGAFAVVVVAVIGVGILIRSGAPATPSHNPTTAAAPLPDTAAIHLARINMDRDIGHLILPEHSASPAEQPLRLGVRWDPSEIERWVGQ
jgi:hypothetical protein